jgi:hypothetical protein
LRVPDPSWLHPTCLADGTDSTVSLTWQNLSGQYAHKKSPLGIT